MKRLGQRTALQISRLSVDELSPAVADLSKRAIALNFRQNRGNFRASGLKASSPQR
jgi:hypothetical protein